MLPLIGRIADLRGRVPVLVVALVRLRARLAGHRAGLRPAQHGGRPLPPGRRRRRAGAGHAGPGRRPLPRRAPRRPARHRLGGPGDRLACSARCSARVVLAVADWRAIFLINLAVGLVLAAAIRTPRARGEARGDRPRPARRRPDLVGLAPPARSPWPAASLVFVQPAGADARPHLGPALHPVRRRRPLAHPGRRWSRSCAARAVPRALLRPRRARWSTCAAGCGALREADLVGALLLARRAGRRDPRLRHRRPQGPGLLRPGLGGTSSAPRSPRSRFVLAPAPRRGPAGPARRAAPYARLGRAAGQLLRRRGADRRAHRHPDLRPHHRLPRRPS